MSKLKKIMKVTIFSLTLLLFWGLGQSMATYSWFTDKEEILCDLIISMAKNEEIKISSEQDTVEQPNEDVEMPNKPETVEPLNEEVEIPSEPEIVEPQKEEIEIPSEPETVELSKEEIGIPNELEISDN